jgi:hypothetical protein
MHRDKLGTSLYGRSVTVIPNENIATAFLDYDATIKAVGFNGFEYRANVSLSRVLRVLPQGPDRDHFKAVVDDVHGLGFACHPMTAWQKCSEKQTSPFQHGGSALTNLQFPGPLISINQITRNPTAANSYARAR